LFGVEKDKPLTTLPANKSRDQIDILDRHLKLQKQQLANYHSSSPSQNYLSKPTANGPSLNEKAYLGSPPFKKSNVSEQHFAGKANEYADPKNGYLIDPSSLQSERVYGSKALKNISGMKLY